MRNLRIILIAIAAFYTNVLSAPTSTFSSFTSSEPSQPPTTTVKEIELSTIESPSKINNDEVTDSPSVTTHIASSTPRDMNAEERLLEEITPGKPIDATMEENETENAPHIGIEAKKGRPKEDKKKALKAAQQQSDKKIKPKQKIFADINYSTKAPTALPPQEEHSDATTDEMHDTTVTVSTSIKIAPTTIKSTTLTTTTMHPTTEMMPAGDQQKHEDVITEVTTIETASVHNGDNVIVLNNNSKSEGLIIVDVIENFGKEQENSSRTSTENSIEIKMDLIDETDATEASKDEIFTTTIESSSAKLESSTSSAKQTPSDDIILINEGTAATPHSTIKWNEMGRSDDIKITFDNIEIPHQNINVSIENGELIIDSIDISVLNRVEEDIRKRANETAQSSPKANNNSLEIVLVEDNENSSTTTSAIDNSAHITEQSPTTIHFEIPPKKIEMDGNGDDIKIKTTDKDSDTIFYISNTEVKVIESIPTSSPNEASDMTQVRRPAIYEEDVIVDLPKGEKEKASKSETPSSPRDKYEEDIVLSPLTNDFDPKDINYIGEAFLDVEQSANGAGISENRHIIPLTSDVVIQPVELKDLPNVPIIGEPPSIELGELTFSDDYDSGVSSSIAINKKANFHVEEFSPFLLNNRLLKNELGAEVPRDLILDTSNSTILSAIAVAPNRTHISVNTIINGTNMTTASPMANVTAAIVSDSEEMAENSDLNDIQTLLVACLATLAPLFLCVIIALTIRYCWVKYCGHDSGSDLISDKSTDPLAGKNTGSIDEMKSTESEMTLNRGNGTSTELLLANANGDVVGSNGIHNDTNGSIIKMTMKNNHLIVETEERNDISRDTRETKMHYSPSEKDGVFIVEAARGADQNGSHKPSPLLQKSTDAPLEIPEEIKLDTLQSHFTPSSPEEERKQNSKPEQVEVHTPPVEIKDPAVTPKEADPVICNGTKTGLTSSDLSLTSSNSSNQNYTYGDRDSYNYEEKGYRGSSPKRIINVHCHDLKPLIENSPPINQNNTNNNNIINNNNNNDKPVITSAIYKNDSQDDAEMLKSDMQAIEENANDVKGQKVHAKINGIIHTNGLDEITTVPDENCNDTIVGGTIKAVECNGEMTMDSLSYLPAPPPTAEEELTSLDQLDSFPPPPPPENDTIAASS